MIASFSRGFIFIKSRKTGSTSVEIVLSSWCSGSDICTPVTSADERLRAEFGGAPRNYRDEGGRRFYNHMPAAEIAELLPDLWRRAYRLVIDRHPYEKVVSQAWWKLQGKEPPGSNAVLRMVDEIVQRKSYLNYPLYCIGNRLAVDEVIRYESMWKRLGDLAVDWGVRLPDRLPAAKSAYRKNRRPAVEVLTAGQMARIRADASIEFELLGYAG